MNCWKTVNVQREIGINRIYLISFLVGLLSFILLYLPFSIVHQTSNVKDHGIFPLLIGLLLLPVVHKFVHFIPLLLTNRTFKFNCRLHKKTFPIIKVLLRAKMSKRTSIITLLAPTIFLTIPGLVASYFFGEYFVYFLIISAVNIGLSYTDFIYTGQFIRAPRKCIVVNDGTGYDILISR
ncbi:putative membrane protein YhaJ [Paraliobacillus quinghaiensis]|uniref:Membrane protein YhaJ n=1 Tax=Paraliobacillus quinghaiensis TaxID=470815 RepID=A0A917TJB2_9BACI|nr:DUF3267 domain-containing protein [Paraliobacillus quinghaiensis]GGM25506.1 putative membrane protein YhaJ [Paraliobacillus quinghaiensis]